MQKLHPKAKWLFFLKSSWVLIIAYIPFVFIFIPEISKLYDTAQQIGGNGNTSTSGDIGTIQVALYLIAILIINFIIALLRYHNYKYELTNDAYRAERGIITKRYVSIPYERIQNVDIHRGAFARILGLSEILVQTAGYGATGATGAGSEGRLPGLSIKNAESIRDELIKKAKGKKEPTI